MKKRLLTLTLTLALALSLAAPAGAGDMGTTERPTTLGASGTLSAFVDGNGDLWLWGNNGYGQLGNGLTGNVKQETEEEFAEYNDYYNQNVPAKLMGDVVSVAVGGFHMAVLKEDGTVWTWGSNDSGQIGIDGGNEYDRYLESLGIEEKLYFQTVPVKVLEDAAAVSASDTHTAAIKTDGSLWMWGSNGDGQLGLGDQPDMEYQEDTLGDPCRNVPTKVMEDVKAVACGYGHTLILKTDGTLWACGNNVYGQVGNGKEGDVVITTTEVFPEENTTVTYEGQPHQPVPVKIMEDVAAISADLGISAAVKTDGTLWMWGNNDDGQLGNGGGGNDTYYESGAPMQTVPVQIMEDVAQVSLSSMNTAAVKTDGSLWMWGDSRHCNFGLGTPPSTELKGAIEPVPVKVMEDVSDAAVSPFHTMAVKTDGTLWVWGLAFEILGTGGKGNMTHPDGDYEVQTVPVQLEFPSTMTDEELLDYLTEKGVKNLRVSQEDETEITLYVHLRDLASILDGTENQFNVDWKDGQICLTTGVPYTTRTGGECQPIQGAETCLPGELTLLADGSPVTLAVQTVVDAKGGGHTFLSLPDLEEILK